MPDSCLFVYVKILFTECFFMFLSTILSVLLIERLVCLVFMSPSCLNTEFFFFSASPFISCVTGQK